MEPAKLSENGHFVLLTYSKKLVEMERMEELQSFINGLLYTDSEHSHYPNYDYKAYGQEYLNILYATTSYLQKEESEYFLAGKGIFTEQGESAFSKELKMLSDMNVLWKQDIQSFQGWIKV